MVPSEFQVPPRPSGASAMTKTCPLERSTRLSFPSAKNPMDRLSGDQNGYWAPSVEGSSRRPAASTERSQSLFPWLEVPATAIIRPSGEIALPPATPRRKVTPDGGLI